VRAPDDGELELEEDDELNLGDATEQEMEQEERDEPEMMQNARKWDHFMELEAEAKREWAAPEDDTREYREQRAVDFFNAAGVRLPDSNRRIRVPIPCMQFAVDLMTRSSV